MAGLLASLLLAQASVAAGFRTVTGSYTGDGNGTHAITGIGFRPDLVLVKGNLPAPTIAKTTTMSGNVAKELGPNTALVSNRILSLDADGFTVGSDTSVNGLAGTYHWVAFETTPELMIVDSYIGDGQDNRSIFLGWNPGYVLVMAGSAEESMQRFSSEAVDRSLSLRDAGEQPDRIQDFEPDGFQIGTHNTVNSTGIVYHYVAWRRAPGLFSDGSYTGDGSANRPFASLSFTPRFLLLTRMNTGSPTVHRPVSLTGDNTLYIDATGSTFTGGIQSLDPNGFTLGAHSAVNAAGQPYYWVAFGGEADLRVASVVSNPVTSVGNTLTFTTTLENLGPGMATGIQVGTSLSPGLTYVQNTRSSGSYDPLTRTWSLGSLAVNTTATLTITALVDPGTAGLTLFHTAATTAMDQVDPVSSNDSVSVAAFVTTQGSDLSLAASVDHPTPSEGDTLTFTTTLDNLGPETATGIRVTAPTPAGMTYGSSAADVGGYDPLTGVWSLDSLAAGSNASLALTATVDAGTYGSTLVHTATVTGVDQVDPVSANDSVSTAVSVPMCDLALASSVDDAAPSEGDTLTFTTQITNLGPDTATEISLGDSLSDALVVLGRSVSRGSYAAGAWSITDLPADSSATLQLRVRLSTGTGASALAYVAGITRSHETDPFPGNDTARVEIRTVEIEALPLGAREVLPGTADAPLLGLRFRNHQRRSLEITGLSFAVSAGIDSLRLWLDDGDRILDAERDSLLADGVPAAGVWDAVNPGLELPAEGIRTLFLSGDVALLTVQHEQVLSGIVPSPAGISWVDPPAVVTLGGFPLRSAGSLRVAHIARAQIGFTPQPPATVPPGSNAIPVLQLRLPDDGGAADQLDRFDVLQIGSGVAGSELVALHLQELVAPGKPGGAPAAESSVPRAWKTLEAAQFFHTGAGRWSANGFALQVPAGGLEVRILADVGASARENTSLRLALPRSALAFASGRVGPQDSLWSNPDSILIRSEDVLRVSQLAVDFGSLVQPRDAVDLAVLGLALEARGALADTLRSLRLLHTSTGPTGPATNPHAQIASADLWLDVEGDGRLGANDVRIDSTRPDPSEELRFGDPAALGVVLGPSTPVRLIVSLTPDSLLVRDAEMLQVRLEAAADLVIASSLPVQLPGALETLVPPVIDGQSAAGYAVRAVPGGALLAGSMRKVVLDLTFPPNGVDDDVLRSLRVTNAGTVVASDLQTVQLHADDGNGTFGVEDTLVGVLTSVGARTWENLDLRFPLETSRRGRRFFVSIDASATPASGASLQMQVPPFGVGVESGNDGPIDAALLGGSPFVFSLPDRVTWIAGIANDHQVRPDRHRQPVMVLETFNGYVTRRTLTSLRVILTGTATAVEYDTWSLVSDDNMNGVLDAEELALAVAAPASDVVLFEGFEYPMEPLQQQRLLVTYGLQRDQVRDGVSIDARVADPEAIRYGDAGTVSDGAFPLDSPGIDTVDGFVHDQASGRPLASRSLGGGETNVLLFDVLLPANGWTADVLQGFALEPVDPVTAGVLGQDFANLRLWSEADTNMNMGTFDPGADRLLQAAVDDGGRWRFSNLDAAVPVGGLRVYVTMDVLPSPTPGRQMQLRIPILGVDMASGNDGPNDVPLDASAKHLFSASALLASVEVSRETGSLGQSVEVTVPVRNQGAALLADVIPALLDVVPAGAASLLAGPAPSQLTLNPDTEGRFVFQYRLDQSGPVRFVARVTVPDSSLWSDLATSPPVDVVSPPSALELDLVSNLPASVYRGQTVTPVVWQLRHPDPTGSAGIRIDTLSVAVEDGAGNALVASTALEALRIGTGSLVHAFWDSIPATSTLRIGLDPPLHLGVAGSIDLPLLVTISRQATARDVRFRISAATFVRAVDANSEVPVPLDANLPWVNAGATIHSRAARIDVTAVRSLPVRVNRGQLDVPAGRFTLDLPGSDDESEVRLLQISLALRDSSGAAIAPEDLLRRLRVVSGSTTLLDTSTFETADDLLALPLSIPALVASGAPQTVELRLDLSDVANPGHFFVVLPDSTAFLVRDATGGERVPVQLSGGDVFPWTAGPAIVEAPAGNVEVRATSRTPASVLAGTAALRALDLLLFRPLDVQPSADVEVRALTLELLDELGNTLVPARMLTAARVLSNGGIVPALGMLPSVAAPVRLDFDAPLFLAAGDSLRLALEIDLAPSLPANWLRFALEPGAVDLHDANDPARPVVIGSGLPFATQPMRITVSASQALFGPTTAPPANVARGAASELLALRLQHPGAALETSLQLEGLVVLLRDVAAVPRAATAFVSSGRLYFPADDVSVTAALVADSLVFDLGGLPPLAPGASVAATLQLDVLDAPSFTDLRLAFESTCLRVRSDAGPVAVGGIPGVTLPWISDTVHLSTQDLRQSLGTYPNPFVPAQHGTCHLTFFLPEAARVSAEIYSLDGERVVALLDDEPLSPGLHDAIPWDGRNGRGELVRNGTYLLRLRVSGGAGGTLLHKLAVQR